MVCVRSIARYVSGAAVGGSGGEGHERGGSKERTESTQLSDAGSHSEATDVANEGSYSQSCFFGPSTITVSRFHRMIDSVYFPEGMGSRARGGDYSRAQS
jgi:hypothetical protein